MKSLRNLSRLTFAVLMILLGILVWTGFQQNRLISRYDTIVEESERIIFLYATIREQITEALLSRDSVQLVLQATEVEKFNSRYTSMLENHLIPSQYKLSFLKDLDFEQLAVSLKNLGERSDSDDNVLEIFGHLRQINKQFLQFDRIVVSEMKSKVMQYQKSALILMGIIISITCFTLVILYQKTVRPLLDLAYQGRRALTDGEFVALRAGSNSSVEVGVFVDVFNQLLDASQIESQENSRGNRREAEVHAIINEVINGLNGIINYSQLLADYCEAEKMDNEQKKILLKIIETGEKSAAILQNGFHGTDV